MNIWLDDHIYQLQPHGGGVSRLWQALTPALQDALPEATWDASADCDVFISTYYRMPQSGARSIAVVYDFIAERYPQIGPMNYDAVQKRQAIAHADAVVAISKATAQDTERYCGKRASVAYCGGSDYTRASRADVADFRQRYGLDKPYVLLVGRRGLYKNARALYQAWPMFTGHEQGTVLAVGGEDPDQDDLQFASSYDWRHVRLADSDMSAAYSGAFALVYPTLLEGFGLPVVEAMSCGCPVITGTGGSLQEVGGNAALYVNPLIPRQIAQALDALDAPTRWQCIERGYAQAKRFAWETMAANVAQVVRGVAV